MRYHLTTEPNSEEHSGDSPDQLAHHLKIVEKQPYVQVWIHKADGQSLGVFFNRHFASVGWLSDDGSSADAFDPDYSGSEDAMQEFYIENGQLDEYRTSNCVSTQEGKASLLFFLEHGRKPDWLHWREN